MAKFEFKIDTQLKQVFADMADDIAVSCTDTAREVEAGLKSELRAQVEGAGLGTRVANVWRGKVYPEGRASIAAAAYVWSNAAKIVDAFDRGPTIVPVNGRKYLAIPTENVPRRTGRRGGASRMTPAEVEKAFGQPLIFERTKAGKLIAFIEAVSAKSGAGWRRPTKGRLRQGRTAQAVIMFFLVSAARMPKRLNVDEAALYWANQVPAILERRIAKVR